MVRSLISFIRRKVFRISKYRWDYQYSKGQWDGLRAQEMQRIFVARELLKKYSLNGKILEIGCGEGIFFQHISDQDYTFYEGIDLSEVAIRMTTKTTKSIFAAADMEKYIPINKPFTVIVLNEVLYYSKDPIKLLQKYVRFLEGEGVFLVGMYDSPKSRTIWQKLENYFSDLESVEVQQDSKVWIYKVLRENSPT